MSIVSERLRTLREGMRFSQKKMADLLGVAQPSINRYEHGQSVPSVDTLVKYADYFDVSMDYITGRCDAPQGKLYRAVPPAYTNNSELRRFVDMCFDPDSPMNEKLKSTLIQMLGEVEA